MRHHECTDQRLHASLKRPPLADGCQTAMINVNRVLSDPVTSRFIREPRSFLDAHLCVVPLHSAFGLSMGLFNFAQSHIASIVTTNSTIVNCLRGEKEGIFG